MLSTCPWGNSLSPFQTQLCKTVTEWSELCFRSGKRIPRQIFTLWEHENHLGPMSIPKDDLSLKTSLLLSCRYQKTDYNQVKLSLSFVDPTLVWAREIGILQYRPIL